MDVREQIRIKSPKFCVNFKKTQLDTDANERCFEMVLRGMLVDIQNYCSDTEPTSDE